MKKNILKANVINKKLMRNNKKMKYEYDLDKENAVKIAYINIVDKIFENKMLEDYEEILFEEITNHLINRNKNQWYKLLKKD